MKDKGEEGLTQEWTIVGKLLSKMQKELEENEIVCTELFDIDLSPYQISTSLKLFLSWKLKNDGN